MISRWDMNTDQNGITEIRNSETMSIGLCGGLESAKMQLPGMSTQLNPGYLQDRTTHWKIQNTCLLGFYDVELPCLW